MIENSEFLEPIRHPQKDWLCCNLFNFAPKIDKATLEYPIFALTTRKDLNHIKYEIDDNYSLEVIPSILGRATIHDSDILNYIGSHMMIAKNKGFSIPRKVRFYSYDFLVETNQSVDDRSRYGGKDFRELEKRLDRLKGTQLKAKLKIKSMGETPFIVNNDGLIYNYKILNKNKKGTITEWEVTPSDLLIKLVEGNEVLTINGDYYRLRKPTDRRFYQIGRNRCGYQDEFRISWEKLYTSSGSLSTLRHFKSETKKTIQSNHIPDYNMLIDYNRKTGKELILFTPKEPTENTPRPPTKRKKELESPQYELLKIALSKTSAEFEFKSSYPEYCFYACSKDWIISTINKQMRISNPRKAFLSFAEIWVMNRRGY